MEIFFLIGAVKVSSCIVRDQLMCFRNLLKQSPCFLESVYSSSYTYLSSDHSNPFADDAVGVW